MTITVLGRLTSVNVQKVIWTLEELALPYEQVDVGGRHGGTETPDYRAMNPNGLVPTLRDDDLVIWESSAIVRYLAARYGTATLWRADPAERAIVDQWTDWVGSTFQPAWLDVFMKLVRTPPAQQNADAISLAVAKASASFRTLDARLASQPYLAGSSLSVADIVAAAGLYRWFTMEIQRPALTNVETYYARMSDRPAYRKAVHVSYEELRAR